MRLLAVFAVALLVSAGLSAPAFADGEGTGCPRAAMAASMSQKSTETVAETPAVPTEAPTTQTVTTSTTSTGG